jgi:hypothetical protein
VLAIASTMGFRRRVYERLRHAGGEVSQGTVGEFAIAREVIPPEYILQLGQFAKQGNTYVIPANLSDLAGMTALATTLVKGQS